MAPVFKLPQLSFPPKVKDFFLESIRNQINFASIATRGVGSGNFRTFSRRSVDHPPKGGSEVLKGGVSAATISSMRLQNDDLLRMSLLPVLVGDSLSRYNLVAIIA
jgi:hypothetical protein